MSINPGSSYNHLTLYRNDSVLWTIQGPLSSDLVTGLCMGIFTIVDFMSKGATFTYNATEIIEIGSENGRILIDLTSDTPQHANKLEKSLGNYIIVTRADPSDYLKYNPDDDNYAWWIDNYAETYLEVDKQTGQFVAHSRYIVCQFSSEQFIQGFITICDAYNVDFREFTLGRPFTYNKTTATRTYNNISGYDTTHFTLTPRIPAPIGAFYIDRNEYYNFGKDFE